MTAAPAIYLVRHGATTWNDTGRYQGRVDVPLSEGGVREVHGLAGRLRGVRFDAAYSSTLSRSRQTAALLLEGSGVRALALSALDELSYGTLQGLTPEVRRAQHGHLDARWQAAPWEVSFPGGESLDEVKRRVTPVWDGIASGHAGETVLVAAHGHVNRVLLMHALGLPRETFWSLEQPNAACLVVRGGALGQPARMESLAGVA